MADFKKLADEAAAKAALKSVKGRVQSAFEELTMTEEERALREAERAREAKLTKYKWIAGAILAVLVFLAVMSILAKLWAWFVGLAILGGIAYAIYFYLRPRVKAVQVKAERVLEKHREEEPKEEAHDEERELRIAEEEQKTAEQNRKAALEAAAAREQAIDDELAALKAKAGKR